MKFLLFTHANATGLKTSFDEAGGTQAHTAVRILRHCRQTVGKHDAQGHIQSRSCHRIVQGTSLSCKIVATLSREATNLHILRFLSYQITDQQITRRTLYTGLKL